MRFKEPRSQPEKAGATRLRRLMEQNGWKLYKVHGSTFMKDWPDYYAIHKMHGQRWIETKSDVGNLSIGQIKRFEEWTSNNVSVWVLRDEQDYTMLFGPANWHKYLLKEWRP